MSWPWIYKVNNILISSIAEYDSFELTYSYQDFTLGTNLSTHTRNRANLHMFFSGIYLSCRNRTECNDRRTKITLCNCCSNWSIFAFRFFRSWSRLWSVLSFSSIVLAFWSTDFARSSVCLLCSSIWRFCSSSCLLSCVVSIPAFVAPAWSFLFASCRSTCDETNVVNFCSLRVRETLQLGKWKPPRSEPRPLRLNVHYVSLILQVRWTSRFNATLSNDDRHGHGVRKWEMQGNGNAIKKQMTRADEKKLAVPGKSSDVHSEI